MRIEIVHSRDPDSACGISVYVDGKPVDGYEYDIDPGAGHEFRDWIESRAHDIALASEPVAEILWGDAFDCATSSRYIEHKPEDGRVVERYLDLWVRHWTAHYAKQKTCAHLRGAWGDYGKYQCAECEKALPIPQHPFRARQREGVDIDYCETCRHSQARGNH